MELSHKFDVKKQSFGRRIKVILIPIKTHAKINEIQFCISACVAQLRRRQQQTKIYKIRKIFYFKFKIYLLQTLKAIK